MKKITSVLLAFLMAISTLNGVPVSAFADTGAATEGTCGAEAVWEYDENTKTLEIGGFGAINNYTAASAPWYAFKDEITTLLVGEGITTIGQRAFYNLSALSSVTLPNTLTAINDFAFAGCASLTAFNIPKGVTGISGGVLSSCPALESITVNSENTVFDSRNNCNAIIQTSKNTLVIGCKSTVIPNSVTSIGNYAFSGCEELTSVNIPDSVESIGSSAFSSCAGLTSVTIGNSVTSIGDSAFAACSGLTNITIPDGVESIGSRAFYGCTGLTAVTIPESVTGMAEGVFCNCTGLKSAVINNEKLGKEAFCNCSALEAISIGNEVKTINNAFENCNSLKKVSICNLENWCNLSLGSYYATDNTWKPLIYYHDLYLNGELVTDLVIPDSVTKIGNFAFSGCKSITSVTIPDSVEVIGDYAFKDCTNLTRVNINSMEHWFNISFGRGSNPLTSAHNLYLNNELVTELNIPDTVTEINSSAFSGCTSITSVNIPDSVTSIGSLAFNGCTGLTDITLPSGLTTIENGVFKGCTALTGITLPVGVKSIGSDAFGYCKELKSITIPDGVTTIGKRAFQACSGLTEITIPDSVNSIAPFAFEFCRGLTDIALPSGLTIVEKRTFEECTSLTQITIPDSVTTIGEYAFYRCESLPSVDLPDALTTIRDSAFYDCKELTSITVPASLSYVGMSVFSYCNKLTEIHISDLEQWCKISFYEGQKFEKPYKLYLDNELITDVIIPQGIETISDYAFCKCTNITSVELPDSVTAIGKSAFFGCTELSDITITDSVTSIGETAFSGCASLTSITIPDSVTSIGNSAFSGCSALTSITIPEGVTSIGVSAFKNCAQISNISIPDSVTSVGKGAFDGCTAVESIHIGKGVTENAESIFSSTLKYLKQITVDKNNPVYDSRNNCNALIETASNKLLIGSANSVIPDGVTSIGGSAFNGRAGLTSIIIPASVTDIYGSAFRNCGGLTELTLNEGLKAIGAYAFEGCSSLTSVTIPNSVETMGEYAFNYCSKLSELNIGTGLSEIAEFTFSGCNIHELTVPGNIKSIGQYAFSQNNSLKNVVLEDGVTALEVGTFGYINTLKTIVIPESMENCKSAYNNVDTLIIYSKNNIQCYYAKTVKCFSDSKAYEQLKNSTIVNVVLLCNDKTENHSFKKNRPYCLNGCGAPNEHYDASYNGTCGEGVEWNYDDETYTLTVYGDGAMDNTQPWSAFAPYIKYVEIENGVTSIGNGSFKNCNNVVRVTIPKSVTTIGEGAFEGCPWLRSIAVPVSVTYLGDGVFTGCTRLTLIDYAGTKAQWNAYAESAINAEEIKKAVVYCTDGAIYDETLYYVENSAIYSADKKKLIKIITVTEEKEFNIPEGVEIITEGTCENSEVEVVNCPDSITEIEKDALTGDELQAVNLSDGVSTIDDNAMADETVAIVYNNSVTHKALLNINHPNIVSIELKSESNNVTAKNSAKVNTKPLLSSGVTTTTTASGSYTYTGYEIKPAVIIKKNGKTLSNNNYNDSYSVKKYKNNKNVGKATINIVLKGIARLEGHSAARDITFNITPKKAGSSDVVLGKTSYTYTGKTITPSIKVFGSSSYSSYCKISGMGSSIGKHTVTLEFFGNYIGKVTKDYYITAPSVKRVSKPKVFGQKNKIVVKWKKVKGASGYKVYYSLNKNMKGAKPLNVKASKRKLTINKLKSNTRYFVRVAAYKTVGGRAFPGKQSKTKSAKTK